MCDPARDAAAAQVLEARCVESVVVQQPDLVAPTIQPAVILVAADLDEWLWVAVDFVGQFTRGQCGVQIVSQLAQRRGPGQTHIQIGTEAQQPETAIQVVEFSQAGATLVANDIIPARAGLVRNALSVFADPPHLLEEDGRRLGARLAGSFDRVLLDAPCTGLGALRRRPEARWRKQPRDIPELTALQIELIDAAAAALVPGGILAYVTCSPHRAETTAVVSHALQHLGLESLDTPSALKDVVLNSADLGTSPHVQLWPHVHGTDAMFIALLQKPLVAESSR